MAQPLVTQLHDSGAIAYAIGHLIVAAMVSMRTRTYILLFFISPMITFIAIYTIVRPESNVAAFEVSSAAVVAAVLGVIMEFQRRRQFLAKRAVEESLVELRKYQEDLEWTNNLLEKANRAKTDFISHMSHELRTPLNAVIGFSEFMIEDETGKLGEETREEYLNVIRSSGVHLLDLVNDILDLAKIEAGKTVVNMASIELAPLLERCVSLSSGLLHERKQKVLIVNDGRKSASFYTDKRLLLQVLVNLVSNASKFSPDGSEIRIRARQKDGNWILSVEDQGSGMTSSQLEEALEPFSQFENVYTRTSNGTGLGLSIVKDYARLLGADFRLTSSPGAGTTAELHFTGDADTPPVGQLFT